MRVLITGVAGFVGRHLTALCRSRGATVVGLGRRALQEEERPQGLEAYFAADLADPRQAAEVVRSAAPDRIFHLAAEASVALSWEEPSEVLYNNLFSTEGLLEAVRGQRPDTRVLVAGSGEVYGPVAPSELPVTERQPLRPQSPYAVSKAAADLLAGFYADAHGMQIARTRAFNHAGPGQSETFVISSIARQVAAAEATADDGPRALVVTGDPRVRRDFTDVRDVVRAYWLALEGALSGTFNVCSGSSISVGNLVGELGRLARLPIEHTADSALLRPAEVMELRGSHEALTQVTGWRAEIGIARTLSDTLDWWRARLRTEQEASDLER